MTRRKLRDLVLTLTFIALGVSAGAGVVCATDEGAPAPVDPAVSDEAAEEREPAPQPVGQEADRLFQEGFELQTAGKSEEALAKYLAALEVDPDHVKALWEIGWSYWKLERWADCVAVWRRVLELQPDHAEAPQWLPQAETNLRLESIDPADLADLGPDAVPPKEGPTLRFALGGDTMMGSPLSRSGLPKDGGVTLFDAYREQMIAADVAFVNLEGVLLDSGRSYKCKDDSGSCYAFRSPTGYVSNLVEAGVDVVSVANNHANDFGSTGRETTFATLDEAGVAYSGPLGHETILERDGTTIGLLAFSTSPGQNDLRRTSAATVLVSELASKVDLVVVSFHGGAEGSSAQHVRGTKETFYGEDRGDVKAFAHAVVDAGADLVVGHGPHVLRGVELYRERLVLYSLGNFCTYGGFGLKGALGVTMLAVVDLHPDGRLAGGRLLPGRQVPPGGPRLDPDGEAIKLVKVLSEQDFGATAAVVADDGTIEGVKE
jgi:poly-gamma-glutamate capsule biosynthesis protein CapA/YwtB (metallophosphatase superfamily)